MNTNLNNKYFGWLFWLFLTANASAQGDLYCKEYEKDCQNAKSFFTEQKSKLEIAAKTCNLSAKFLFSIVAPEITQFSYLSNKIETYSIPIYENGIKTEWSVDGVVGDEKYKQLIEMSPEGKLPIIINTNTKK